MAAALLEVPSPQLTCTLHNDLLVSATTWVTACWMLLVQFVLSQAAVQGSQLPYEVHSYLPFISWEVSGH